LKNLELSLNKLEINWSGTKTNQEVDEIVDIITNTIANSAIISKLPRKLFSKNKLDFWCEELSNFKYKKQDAYDVKGMSDENERLYRDLKSKYQCLLRKNKEKAKIKYMTEDMNNDP
jgi:hypothetical protein